MSAYDFLPKLSTVPLPLPAPGAVAGAFYDHSDRQTSVGLNTPQVGSFPNVRAMNTQVTRNAEGVATGTNTTMAGLDYNPATTGQSGFWGGAYGPTAAVHDQLDEDGFNIGCQVNSASFGAGYRTVNQGTDRGLRVGLGTGGAAPGFGVAGLRGSATDIDGDGRPEYNYGVSLPLGVAGIPAGASIDYSTETPRGDALSESLISPVVNTVAPALGLLAGKGVNVAMSALGLGDYAPGSLLDNVFGTDTP